ncbi:lipid A deacylase LpxR family protein [Acidisphaera sp. S103]|uniref:lipid A deacylase LpxR family protein n=1 Tax=Acidisphaera sp. S103 TaxID=1747223 RepID=UPI00131ED007|nr:lipid A deacylase LpxR family protein [Acidisphaera sp. S103]
MNLRTLTVLAGTLVLPAFAAHAQAAADTASIWTLQDENASITTGTPPDRFYVNGLRLGWTSPTGQVPNFLADLGRTLWGSGQQRIAFDLAQQIYTPAGTSFAVPSPFDRPFAGVLLGNFSLISDTADTRSVLTVSLGLVGPASGAEELQNSFHDLIGQNHTNGWGSQIQNTPIGEILHERTWRLPMGTVAGLETDALPSLTIGLGDLRDYVQTGVTFRFGQGLDSDFGVPRIRPGLSGGDVFVPTRPFAWYVFAGADGQAVAYDLLLQSSPFRGGPHVSTVWDVAEFQGGFAVMAYGMRLTVAYVAQTQEFHGQTGGLHQFGSASLAFRF